MFHLDLKAAVEVETFHQTLFSFIIRTYHSLELVTDGIVEKRVP